MDGGRVKPPVSHVVEEGLPTGGVDFTVTDRLETARILERKVESSDPAEQG
jgi:hypothetical protein